MTSTRTTWIALSVVAAVGGLVPTPVAVAQGSAPVMVVFDIENRSARLSQKVTDGLSDLLAVQMDATENFQVVARDELRRRLGSIKAASLKSCFADECQIEIGMALGAEVVLGSQVVRVDDQCHVAFRLFDLRSGTKARGVLVEGGCAENDLVTSVKVGVSELVGTQLKAPRGRFRPVNTANLEFDQVDVDALELYDAAVRLEDDPESSVDSKVAAWRAVETRAPAYAATARSRIRVWTRYQSGNRESAKVRAQRNEDWIKLSRLLTLSIIPEPDKLRWALAFVETYGEDPELNPFILEPALRAWLARGDWDALEEQLAQIESADERRRMLIRFLVKYPQYKPAQESFAALRRSNLVSDSGPRP